MKVGLGLFISSALFTGTLTAVYGLHAREAAGTTLLAFMTAALLVVAGYMTFAERHADLYADKPDATMRDAAGEHVGTYITHSPIPFWVGLAVTAIVIGLVVSPAAAGLGLIALAVLAALLVVRSR